MDDPRLDDPRIDDPRNSWLAALVRTPLKTSRTTPAEAALLNISLMVTTCHPQLGEWPTQARFWLEWGCAHVADCLLAHFLDALFQHVHGDVGFFFGHDQRRAQAD